MKVAPGTISVWSDIGCPWSHAVVWRLHDARRRLGLEGRVTFDHHAFPLELFNNEPTPRPLLEAEWPVAAKLAPRAGWQAWSAPEHAWPVTMLPPMEAVQAAKLQSPAASEDLDRGLRRAFWGESRCISLRHVILEVANECDGLDVALLTEALDDGRARRALLDDWAIARGDEVSGSAHLFAPDGTSAQNPGISIGWHDDDGGGFATIEADDPSVIDDLVRRSAG
ncbi:MAG TPA: DsbA family protein [Methylomirabilota bacterium]|nr:DsbA family protein [Methylomirabilota bacterium]